MDEILRILGQASPFVVLAALVWQYFRVREKEAAALIVAEELRLETAKIHAADNEQRSIREAKLATELELSRTQQAEYQAKRAEADLQASILNAKTLETVAALVLAQKQTTRSIGASEKRIIASGDDNAKATKDLLIALAKLVGDTNIITAAMQEAMEELADKMKDVPGGVAAVGALVDAVKDSTLDSDIAGKVLQ